ncbi:hypothetical protein [Nocardia sp. alder85J]|uniref:hypothetical protein n=1 Tax=Nocardia sp. alder85J TaxID=2862949 RepID=UPI001CD2AF7E|nr:hypothetical protein [Nocardia sp. alder85J]MCX4098371.1 hypothetical protein [Nocardia sp. alder85J]
MPGARRSAPGTAKWCGIGGCILAVIACVITGSVAACSAAATTHYSWQTFAVLAGVCGIGFAFFCTAGSVLIVDALPEQQQGIRSGMLGVTMRLGHRHRHPGRFPVRQALTAHIEVKGRAVDEPISHMFGDCRYSLTF